MLDPDIRGLYTDALRPPPGYRFDRAVATTYTLDLTTLLFVPLHLTLFGAGEDGEAILRDGVNLLEALRKTTEVLQVYCHRGQMAVPQTPHPLFSLLEPVVVQATAPRRGFFHPKLWLLRFTSSEVDRPHLRLLILSRNMTRARSLDLLLRLEGIVGGKRRKVNAPFIDLLERLPGLAVAGGSRPDRQLVRRLADDVARTVWQPPEPFREVRFHVTGLERGPWKPPSSKKLLVISAFVSDAGLRSVVATSSQPVALVSRPEELERLESSTRAAFGSVLHLQELGEEDDTDEMDDLLVVLKGLHAKAFLCEDGATTRAFVGSMNATSAGVDGANVELMAELIGPRKKIGQLETLLEDCGLIKVLQEFVPGQIEAPPPEEESARAALEAGRKQLLDAGFRVRCEEEAGGWSMLLDWSKDLRFEGLKAVRVWPITAPRAQAASLLRQPPERRIRFPCELVSLTSFFAFELEAEAVELDLRFACTLPIDGVPEERYAAIFRSVVADREKFIRYLLLLLAGEEEGWLRSPAGGKGARWDSITRSEIPLLEEIVRAFCRDPERFGAVKTVVDRLRADPGSRDVFPEGFLDLWQVIASEFEEPRGRVPA